LRDIKVILFSYLCQLSLPSSFLFLYPSFPSSFLLNNHYLNFYYFPLLTFRTVRCTIPYSGITSIIPTYKYQRVRCLNFALCPHAAEAIRAWREARDKLRALNYISEGSIIATGPLGQPRCYWQGPTAGSLLHHHVSS